MALTKEIILENGITLSNAYIKIESLQFYNKVGEISFVDLTVSIFKDEDARIDRRPEVLQINHRCSGETFESYFSLDILNQEGFNMISQGYSWLKTLSFYVGAVDSQDSKEK